MVPVRYDTHCHTETVLPPSLTADDKHDFTANFGNFLLTTRSFIALLFSSGGMPYPETNIQVAGRDRDIWIEKRKKNIFAGLTRAARQDNNLLYRHDNPNEPIKEGPPSFVLQKSLFALVSTVSWGLPSVVSLAIPYEPY